MTAADEEARVSGSIEREVTLLAPSGFALPVMDGAIPGLSDGLSAQRELDAVYYDTKDLALARAGVTLSCRGADAGQRWTVKLPKRAGRSTLTRLTVQFDGAPDIVPAEARDLVRAYLRSRRLRPVARLHTLRTSVTMLDASGNCAVELLDDVVTLGDVAGADDGDRGPATLHQVRVVLAGAAGRRRFRRAAVDRLVAAGCQRTTPRPTLVDVLGNRAAAAPDVVVVPLDAESTVGELVRHAISASVERLIRCDAGVRLGADPEDVHQFRVAARTLRSNLASFASVLDREWTRVLRAELGWLGSEAGRARDLDVLDHRLRRLSVGLGEQDLAGVAVLFDRVAEQSGNARKATLAALRCHRYDFLLKLLVEAAAEPAFASGARIDGPARTFLRRAARTQMHMLDRAATAASDSSPDDDLHAVRILAKRARYAIEVSRLLFGARATNYAASLARLQDVLGELHDSAFAAQWLREAARSRSASALAAGQLIAAEHAEQAELRRVVQKIWRRDATKNARRWR